MSTTDDNKVERNPDVIATDVEVVWNLLKTCRRGSIQGGTLQLTDVDQRQREFLLSVSGYDQAKQLVPREDLVKALAGLISNIREQADATRMAAETKAAVMNLLRHFGKMVQSLLVEELPFEQMVPTVTELLRIETRLKNFWQREVILGVSQASELRAAGDDH